MASDRTLAASRIVSRPLYLQVRDALIERIGKGTGSQVWRSLTRSNWHGSSG